jgi:CheY-like chemotaxis protein
VIAAPMPTAPQQSAWPVAANGHPAGVAEPSVTPGQPISLDRTSLDGTTVLIVDDDFRNVFALTALLERVQATVQTAESGPDAISLLERRSGIDLVLMDIMMPVMDGYETIRTIRAHDAFSSIPIIAVTGKVVAGERERCLEAGANDYVPKPVNTAELLNAIGPWIPDVARPTP